MNILVTGHEGFIGRNMLSWLHQQDGWTVDGWEWDPKDFPDVHSYDWVIHLGAIADNGFTDVDVILNQNLEFSQWLFNECNTHGVNLQYASSSTVYGNTKSFSEHSPCHPQTPYAWSKYLFDRWVFQQEQHIMVQGFRYFNVYGNHEDHKGTQASPITQFNKQNPIKLFYNSEQYLRDFIAVEDICRVHVDFIQKVSASGIWNIGTGTARSFQEVANIISQRNNTCIAYTEMPEILKSSYQKYTCADLTRLEDAIGVQRWISIEEWLDKYKL